MNQLLLITLLFLGCVVILSLVFRQVYNGRITELQVANLELDSQLKTAISERASAVAVAARIPELEKLLIDIQHEKETLLQENSSLKKQQESDAEKNAWTEQRQAQLREAFSSLSTDVLKSNSEQYLNSAKEIFEGLLTRVRGDWGTHKVELQKMVEPLEKTLSTLDQYTKDIETKREGAYSGLQEQLRQLADTQGQLQISTTKLTQALRSPNVRGNWGQEQLRRIVELANMLDNVDFAEQVSIAEGRPDMVVNLPNKGFLPVDAKTPMTSYLDAMESDDEIFRNLKFQELAVTMRSTIKNLGSKEYWKKLDRSPEVVIMFIPSDGCIAAAFEHDIGLFDFAVNNNVIITSPFTLYALLKSVAYGWQQHRVAENSRLIINESKELHERLSKFVGHLKSVGAGLKRAVESFNDSVGSFDHRVLPSARRLREMGTSSTEIEAPNSIDVTPQITDEEEPEK